MSKALLKQHAAKALKEQAEQQQKHQIAHQAQHAQHTQAIAQANTNNRSLQAEVDQLKVDLQNHIGQDVLPAYEDICCAGAVRE